MDLSNSDHPLSSSMLLKDISNFKTPRRPPQSKPFDSQTPNAHFFTASKQTPRSLSHASALRSAPRSSLASCSKRSKASAARRLKAFEIEQSQSSRKVQLKKERSLKTLSKSLTVWLNFLLQNPSLCGCGSALENPGPATNGKRDSGPRTAVGFEPIWQVPKRQREMCWQNPEERDSVSGLSISMFVKLRDSLKEICSLDDLTQRMRVYLSLDRCKEIFTVMTQATKSIDEGRLNMKSHCPIISDFGMKEKAIKLLLCYNPAWLRIGFHIIFGGDSLLPNGERDHDEDLAFLKIIIEKQFLSHADLAKAYAYNKKVEGLFRPGYYENLGNIILKRFLLLVLVLDRVKYHSNLSLNYGIDGLDGGSPLLFTVHSSVKSSSQVISDFLSSEVMHGEGNLLGHLTIVGFKVSYEQSPLVEYDFRLTDVLQDLQDGVRLCRATQLLKQDPSILMKLKVPADTPKKRLANCNIAFQHLKRSGVPLYDEDGVMIEADDIANGDKELTLTLVWNMFAHLQLPLLINEKLIADEVIHIGGVVSDKSLGTSSTSLDTLFCWIKAIGEKYELKIENQNSLTDGKAVWCLLDYYFHKELDCSCSQKAEKSEGSIVAAGDYADPVHNFVLSQRLATLLGNFPEVLEIGDILEHHGACNGRSVVILLVFLAYQLVIRKNMHELNFHKLLGCTCQSFERRYSSHESLRSDSKVVIKQDDKEAARRFKAILGWWQKMSETNSNSMAISNITSNSFIVGDLSDKDKRENAASVIQSRYRGYIVRCKFLKTMKATCLLQKAIQAWLLARFEAHRANAAKTIQTAWKRFIAENVARVHHSAAINIQCSFRGWVLRRDYLVQKKSAVKIQRAIRHLKTKRLLQEAKALNSSAIIIQSYVRRWIAHRWIRKHKLGIPQIQSHCRGWLTRRTFFSLRDAAITLQSVIRCNASSKRFQKHRNAATQIQCLVRMQISHKRLLEASAACGSNLQTATNRTQILSSVVKLQRWWRTVLLARIRSAVVLQSHARGWFARREAARQRRLVVVIQSYWKGYLARKKSHEKVIDLRKRMHKTAANVEDSMRLINRLTAALSELLNVRSVSSILNICSTLDMATRHSQKCCDKLVKAGTIDKLLKLINSVTRSIPDQEVLRHTLSTLRNLGRYPDLVDALIDSHGSVETIFREMLRNKEVYFIASELLKKICSNHKGLETIRKFPALLKRLRGLVEELTRRVDIEKRTSRSISARENTERRLKEASELLKMVSI